MDFYVRDILEATGGKLLCGSEDLAVNDIAIDSRMVKEDSLFVPIKGEKVDAHKFIADVLKTANASLTMEEDVVTDELVESGKALIRVDDTIGAMQAFAAYMRDKYNFPIIGVTGSVGKTTTREMIVTAMTASMNVLETYKNYNSQVGVPMMISRFSEKYDAAVLEMGMSEPGEMGRLSDMVKPDTAVFTLVGVAHIEQLKSQDGIFDEKIKITKHMKKDDIIYLNGDDELLRSRSKDINNKILWYGLSSDCDYKGYDIKIDGEKQTFKVDTPDVKGLEVTLNVLGEHNVRNALVALAVATQYGVDINKAAKALESFSGQRQTVIKTDKGVIIDDTYNASPDSMKASLSVLGGYECKGKRVAVLADMLELGPNEVEYHKEVGRYVKEYGVDYLVAYGSLAKEYLAESGVEGVWVDSLDDAYKETEKFLNPDNILLFKGSNGMKLKDIVTKILQN